MEKQEVRNHLKNVFAYIYSDQNLIGNWQSFRTFPFANLCKDECLDERYARAIKEVLNTTKVDGTTLMIIRGTRGGTQYKFNRDFTDFDALIDKVIDKVKIKGDSESTYKSGSKSDTIPNLKGYKAHSDALNKINKLENGKTLTKKSTMTRSYHLNDKVFILISNQIHEAQVRGIQLDKDNKLIYTLYYTKSNKFSDIIGVEIMAINLYHNEVFDSIDSVLKYLSRNIQKYQVNK